jgi:hypothetical protein
MTIWRYEETVEQAFYQLCYFGFVSLLEIGRGD